MYWSLTCEAAHITLCLHIVHACVKHCSGLDEEGLYRKPGVQSKATKLVKDCVERGKMDSIDLLDEYEWDIKTVASAVKAYFSKYLGEPLLTFDLHMQFVEASSELLLIPLTLLISLTLSPPLPPTTEITDNDKRVEVLRYLVTQLPPDNRTLLLILMQHLNR